MITDTVTRTHLLLKICALLTSFNLLGCAHQPLPAVDFNTGSWHILRGQALWQASASRPRIAGDVMLATDNFGNQYIEFVKTPVVIFTAQTHGNYWQLRIIDSGKTHRGRGTPPEEFIWFYLSARLLDKTPLPDEHWQIVEETQDSIAMNNTLTGAHIRVILDTPLP